MNREGGLLKRILIEATNRGWRLFRNNVGQAWQGRVQTAYPSSTPKGIEECVELVGARRVSYGLAKGSSDLIGWQTVRITPDMVGMRLAVFASVEVKSRSYRTLSDDQRTWLAAVKKAGGIAHVVRENADGTLEWLEGGE